MLDHFTKGSDKLHSVHVRFPPPTPTRFLPTRFFPHVSFITHDFIFPTGFSLCMRVFLHVRFFHLSFSSCKLFRHMTLFSLWPCLPPTPALHMRLFPTGDFCHPSFCSTHVFSLCSDGKTFQKEWVAKSSCLIWSWILLFSYAKKISYILSLWIHSMWTEINSVTWMWLHKSLSGFFWPAQLLR